MKLTNVALFSNGSEVAELSFRDPGNTNPYVAKTIIGLDADEVVPSFSGFGNQSGTKHYSASLASREIVLRVALQPQWATGKGYAELRDDLYRAISSSRTGVVQVRFRDVMTTVAAIEGFVTKVEAPHFTEQPEVQITIKCDDPMLRALEPVQISTAFLGENNTIVSNLSTSPHGFKFNLEFTSGGSYFIVRDATIPEWEFEVNTTFLTGDQLWLSSESTGKYLYIWREPGTPIPDTDYSIHLIDKIAVGSQWPILFPGPNDFQFLSDATYTWDSMSFTPSYWGV